MSHTRFVKIMGWGATLIVGTALVIAFWVVGSPVYARKENADRQRISDLGSIAGSVRSYYKDKKVLPASLNEIHPSQFGPDSTYKDPVTGKPFEYARLDKDHFSLCATFETDTTKSTEQGYDYYGTKEFLRHPVGRYCFTLPTYSPNSP